MRSVLLMIVIGLVVSGCSTINFNERYNGANWNTIIIAPFTGENASVAEQEFEHELAVSNHINVIPASTVLVKMEEHALMKEYEKNPTQTLMKLAAKLEADGIILGEVETSFYRPRSPSAFSKAYAAIYVKLVDAKNMNIVLSSQQDSTSVLSNSKSLLQSISKDSIDEIQQGFVRL